MNLEGQIAIVTGGASGMGLACVEALRKSGAIAIALDKSIQEEKNKAIACNVTSVESIENALQQVMTTVGVPRILINCAGIAPAQRMVGKEAPMPLANFKDVIEVNLVGTFNVMRLAAFHMVQLEPLEDGERGVIINTASIAAYEGQIGQTAYSASKGGIVGLTLPAARELAQFGIRVNTIAPGLFATPLLLNMPETVRNKLTENIPFPKRFGHPEEFAKLALHVIDNPMINGEVIRLDAGLRMI